MTDPVERSQASQDEMPPQESCGGPLPLPGETQLAIQQLREAGFSEGQQAALTTALLRVLALWTSTIEAGDSYDVEHRLRRSDGVYRWFNSRGTPMRDAEGRVAVPERRAVLTPFEG